MSAQIHEHAGALPENLKFALDGLSIATLLGSLINVLPSIAALLTIVWTGLRIWETQTVQGWMGRKGASRGQGGD
jgi:hypothetical protein